MTAPHDPAATIASLRATADAIQRAECMTKAEYPELPGLLTEAAALIEALAAREQLGVTWAIEQDNFKLRDKIAALDLEAENYWKVIEDAMPYIPASSFVAAKIEELEALHTKAKG